MCKCGDVLHVLDRERGGNSCEGNEDAATENEDQGMGRTEIANKRCLELKRMDRIRVDDGWAGRDRLGRMILASFNARDPNVGTGHKRWNTRVCDAGP